MHIRTLVEMGTLLEGEQEIGECSNRVYVPARLFTEWLSTKAVTLRIENAVEQVVYGSMFSAHTQDENTVFVPDWMCSVLDCDRDLCTVVPVEPPRCTAIMVQPLNEGDVEEMELFQSSLERYTTVTPGQHLTLWHSFGYPFTVSVVHVEPEMAVDIANCDIPLNMLPPVSVVPATLSDPDSVPDSVPASVPDSDIAPSATNTVHTVETEIDVRQKCYEAAMRRMSKEKPE
jgi:hypothetical protein